MKVIGLTGEAGSGKSVVISMLQESFGAYVIMEDDVARDLMEPGKVSFNLTLEHFGDKILDPYGKIDRPKLAQIVFSDKKELDVLNSFTHPYVIEEVKNTIDCVKKENKYKVIIIESALPVEGGFKQLCDEIWYISTKEEVRRQRLKENRGYSDEKIDDIIKNQMKSSEFRDFSDKTVENNGDLDTLFKEIEKNLC